MVNVGMYVLKKRWYYIIIVGKTQTPESYLEFFFRHSKLSLNATSLKTVKWLGYKNFLTTYKTLTF